MQKQHKDLLRALVRELRHKLVGSISPTNGNVERGNLDRELERLGIAPDGTIKPIDTLPQVRAHERYAYRVAVAQLSPLSLSQRTTVRGEIVERAAYTWINRLLALRAMEVRGLIDNTLRSDEAYGGISEKLFLLRDTQPERSTGEDGGWWAVIEDACNEQAQFLPGLFSLDDPAAALRPSDGVLVQCVNLVGGNQPGFTSEASDEAFVDPDAIGWAYQFFQEENKANIDAKCKSGGKVVNRYEIAAKTQLFTEPYMVQWLLQNSLGRSYHEAYPQSKLPDIWPYYVKPKKLDTSTHYTLASLTLLDPCMGSGHFLRAAFDMFVSMYREQFPSWHMKDIADRILTHHLHGIDLDPRAAQLTALTLYLRAWELIRDERKQQYHPGPGSYTPPIINLATTPTNLNKGALERHLQLHPQDSLFKSLIEEIFAGLEQADILGSLLRPREYLDNAITALQKVPAMQRNLFDPDMDELRQKIADLAKYDPGELKKLALQRIIDSFRAETENTDDVSAMLFGREAEQGARLLQLLDWQYAVVVTNPPYLGSRYMDTFLKKYIEKHYASGKRDIYAAFILRCLELCNDSGRVAMITQQSWMFFKSYANLRAISATTTPELTKTNFTGLLQETRIELITHLGANAFEEIGGEVVQSVMFILANQLPSQESRITAFRLIGVRSANEKADILRKTHLVQAKSFTFTPYQRDILSIPKTPIVYWLRQTMIDLLSHPHYRFCDIVTTRYGMNTGNNERFLRYFWEILHLSNRWVSYAKGGGYMKWVGMEWYLLDWRQSGAALRAYNNSIIRNPQFYFRQGLTYSRMAQGALGVRYLPSEAAFDSASLSMFPLTTDKINLEEILSVANTRLTSYFLRVISSDIEFNPGYVDRAPFIYPVSHNIRKVIEIIVKLKRTLIGRNSTEYNFENFAWEMPLLLPQALLHTLEGLNEKIISEHYAHGSVIFRSVLEIQH